MYMYLVMLPVSLTYTCICFLSGFLCPWLIHVYVSCQVSCVLGLYMYMYLVKLPELLADTCVCILLGNLCSGLTYLYLSC